jgi:hypothetical protein
MDVRHSGRIWGGCIGLRIGTIEKGNEHSLSIKSGNILTRWPEASRAVSE